MSDSSSLRLKQILLAALNVPSADRSTFLDGACLGDAELRSRAGDMLASLGDDRPIHQATDIDELIRKTFDGDPPTLTKVSALALPTRIGRYPIHAKVGQGGMGIVYSAHDARLDREIAIKTLPHSFAADIDRVTRFRREAKMLATVNHPGITTIYSIEESDSGLFLTMEYVPGSTLAEKIAGTPLVVGETLRIGRQIAGALEASHKRGVIHRDLKPSNVKVTPDNEVKLLDFGIARPIATAPDITNIGEALGTPGYMSPEQLRGNECDQRTDVWSFGCLLYACLTGRSPFAGGTAAEVMAATLVRDPDLGKLPGECPPRLRDLISHCITRSVESRASDMSEVRRTIDELIAGRQVAPDLAERGGSQTPHNLSLGLTSIIGRESELAEVGALLRDHRLVTLAGVGGCGKTRLALEVAWQQLSEFPDGAWFVEFAPLSNPDLVPPTVLAALMLREAPGRSPMDVLVDHAKDRKLLLVLDNCEHVVQAARQFAKELLEACSAVHIVTSSREELGIHGERVLSVPPLGVPANVTGRTRTDIETSASVQLFLQRARLVRPSLELTEANAPIVADICRRLDGLPLALELAAARTRIMSLEDLSGRLDQRLQMLTGGKTPDLRHQTLRGLIEWSYELLEEKEQAVFRRLSVFAGGWTLEAAEAVCQGQTIEGWEVLDLFTRLLEKSLLERDPEGHPGTEGARFRMLETVWEYARERLEESDEANETRGRHREHFLALAEEAAPQFKGPEEPAWLARMSSDHENLRHAMDACQDPGDGELGLRFAVALVSYWAVRGHLDEGQALCARALAHQEARERTQMRGRALNSAGILAERRGDYAAAREHCEESLAISRERMDPENIALALNSLAIVEANQGNNSSARRLYEESLSAFRELEDQAGIGRVLNNLGTVAKNEGDFTAARDHLEESLSIRQELGDRSGVATSLANLALMTAEQGDHAAASHYAKESLAIFRELGDRRGMAAMLVVQGSAAVDTGDYPAARDHYEESLAMRRELGDRRGIGYSLSALGALADRQGDYAAARAYYEQGLAIFRELGHPFGVAESLRLLGIALSWLGISRKAARLLSAAETLFTDIGYELGPAIREQLEAAASRTRAALGHDAFHEEWDLGSRMSVEEIVARALGEDAGTGEQRSPDS